MAASIRPQSGNLKPILDYVRRPLVAGVLLVAYVVLLLIVLASLQRSNTLFSLLSMILFPPFILAPFIVMGAPVSDRFKIIFILVQLVIAVPLLGLYDSSYLELVIQICIFAGLALGLNIVVGFAGLLDLGYIAFFAVGAYCWAMFTSPADTVFMVGGLTVSGSAFYGFIFVGVVVAALAGILLGLPVLRLRGDYLAIVTLGFGEIIRIIAKNLDSPANLTNGSQGLHDVARPSSAIFNPVIEGGERILGLPVRDVEPISDQLLFYFIALLLIGVIILVARRLENSPIGRAWTAIREDEVAAIAMGVPLTRLKLMAFASGAAFAGAIGVLYGAKQTFVSPESFSLIQSISILAMVIVGGLGGIKGVLLGATVVTLLNLQVLKNLSLQINAWKNIDAVVPGTVITILAIVIGLGFLWLAWGQVRATLKNQVRTGSIAYGGWFTVAVLALIGVAVAVGGLGAGDFHLTDWPSQLEPAKYERFVFGLLLVVMMIFRPGGLLPEPRRKMELAAKKEEAKAQVAPAAGD